MVEDDEDDDDDDGLPPSPLSLLIVCLPEAVAEPDNDGRDLEYSR